ncbi:EGF domain containing protein [Trichuris trichiura]|uniref:EGF domain containing protein n=1 Tax=Trichuris trichiura TaxID=36087 RepID=A0A077Z6C6_TRITR|nr:EGF domain containing protein [Trichuris trichiura]
MYLLQRVYRHALRNGYISFILRSSCQNGGKCQALQRGFRCICPPGFFGYRCEFGNARIRLAWDPCTPNPCANDGYCKCPTNFWGKHCETGTFFCEFPIENKVTCSKQNVILFKHTVFLGV